MIDKSIQLTCACVNRTRLFRRCESGNCIADATADATADELFSPPQPRPVICDAALIPEPPRIRLETKKS